MESKYRFSMDLFADEWRAATLSGGTGASKVSRFVANVMKTDLDQLRTERILALRVALNSGSYRVSAGEVAERLMESMMGRK